MKVDQPVSTDGATPARLCPNCSSENTTSMALGGKKRPGREPWKCRDCEYTWELAAESEVGKRPEERIF